MCRRAAELLATDGGSTGKITLNRGAADHFDANRWNEPVSLHQALLRAFSAVLERIKARSSGAGSPKWAACGYWHRARCIGRSVHYILHDDFKELNMPSSDAFALPHSGLNEFLFATVGTGANGMTLSLISVFARLGKRSMAGGWQTGPSTKVGSDRDPGENYCQHANEHVALASGDNDCHSIDCTAADAIDGPRTEPVGIDLSCKFRPHPQDWTRLVSVALAVAFQMGVFTTMDLPKSGGNSVSSFAVSPG